MWTYSDGFTSTADLSAHATTGLAVALNRTSLKYDSGAFVNGEPTRDFSADLRDWLNEHAGLLEPHPKLGAGAWIGGWVDPDTGQAEIAVTWVFQRDRRQIAEAFARAHDQKAMFDLDNMETVDTGGTGEGAWSPAASVR